VIVAALYVESRGCYVGLAGVDPWDATRDARKYDGPYAIVGHPPCERWGNYSEDAIGAKRWNRPRKITGDDGGCFEHALSQARKWGGVIEHPRRSKAWERFGIACPPIAGGWIPAGDGIGWTCCVEQGHYGHRARKATWLYAAHSARPELVWGPSENKIQACCPPNTHRERTRGIVEVMNPKERKATPIPFRDLLLSIARSVYGVPT